MASDKAVDTRLVAATGANTEVNFDGPPLDGIYIYADAANVIVDFDQPTDSSTSMRVPTTTLFEFNLNCKRVYVATTSGTANVYLMGVRRNK